jgi:serine/threonine-protein kinase RsbW
MRKSSDFIEMLIPAKADYVGVARLTVSGIANRMGYSIDEIEDIKIAVSEACTNAVDHAYKEEENGKIRIGFGVFDDRLEIMIVDKGQSFDITSMNGNLGPVKDKPIDQLSEGGLGLFLIETLMDKVEISGDAGVVVMMTKFLHRDEVEQSADKYRPAPSQ